MQFQPENQTDGPEVNLTSLIDVILLLLVFFMVTTSFVRESELAIRLPEVSESADAAVEQAELAITVTAKGSYFVNNRALVDNRPATLQAAIRKIMPELVTKRVSITADAEASHQAVVTAMDVAGKLGFVEISIATVSSSEQGR
jgi:biopolymer transport protein ExbD